MQENRRSDQPVAEFGPGAGSPVATGVGRSQRRASLPLVLAASKSGSAAVREAAVYVLARHGDASAAAILLEAALGGGPAAETARTGLQSLPGRDVDAVITDRWAGTDAKTKPILLGLIGARRIADAQPAVRGALSDTSPPVRLAAIAALGQLVETKDLDLLIVRTVAIGDLEETTAAQAALKTAALRMSDRDATVAMLAARLGGVSAAARTYLLELIGKISGPKALETMVLLAKSNDPTVKDAATKVLGEWVSADAAPALLEIAENDPDAKYQVRALRGYIRIARQLQLPAPTRLAMFRTALKTAKRKEEQRLALDILTRIPSPNTLALAVSHLNQPSLKHASADAAVKIAAKLVAKQPKPVAVAMQKVVQADVGGAVGNRAKQLLEQSKFEFRTFFTGLYTTRRRR